MVTASLTIYGEAIPDDPHNWIKEATQDIAKQNVGMKILSVKG